MYKNTVDKITRSRTDKGTANIYVDWLPNMYYFLDTAFNDCNNNSAYARKISASRSKISSIVLGSSSFHRKFFSFSRHQFFFVPVLEHLEDFDVMMIFRIYIDFNVPIIFDFEVSDIKS